MFWINGDRIDSAHRTLLFDCYELLERKRYMSCILNVAQAYEVFFGLFFRVSLLYRPFASDSDADLNLMNQLAATLHARLKHHTFDAMRALFLRQVTRGSNPAVGSLADAQAVIARLPAKSPGAPKDSEMLALPDPLLAKLLLRLKGVGINILRNNVVHKQAYRPTRDEAHDAHEEAATILFALGERLGVVDDDPNTYSTGST